MSPRRDELGQRSETVRRANLSAIARELHAAGPLSRSELGLRTGLTRSTIRGLIGEFAAAELVEEEKAISLGTPGRPSALVFPNPGRAVVLALDIAVDSVAAAIIGFGGEVLAKVRVDRQRGHLSLEKTVGQLVELADQIGGLPPERKHIIGIGVAIVGVVRRTDGHVSLAPNLGWQDVGLGLALRQALDTLVPIAVANEADLGALAEVRRGTARGSSNVLFISGEVGVGGGLIVDGRPLTGVAGYGGEIGHIPVNRNGTACRCGSVGCWETEVGEDALLSRAGRRRGGGRDEVDAVLREAAAGSPQALAALDSVSRWLGFGLAGLVNVLNPEIIVLGGLFGRIHPFISEVLEAELDGLALTAPRQLVRVVPSILKGDAPLLGAAELAFEPFLADPAQWLRDRGTRPGSTSSTIHHAVEWRVMA